MALVRSVIVSCVRWIGTAVSGEVSRVLVLVCGASVALVRSVIVSCVRWIDTAVSGEVSRVLVLICGASVVVVCHLYIV